jgi:hypothetical protein
MRKSPPCYSPVAKSPWCCPRQLVRPAATLQSNQTYLTKPLVVIFTFLLFLSGYVMQQRTVQSLHTVIRPQAPIPRHKPPLAEASIPINPSKKSTRPFGHLRDRAKLQSHLASQDAPFSWSKLAYAQVVRDHAEVCNALIFFADLNRLKSPVPRLLLFPRPWARDSDGDVLDPSLELSKRLLRKASRRYRVILVPIDPVGSGDGTFSKLQTHN